MRAAHAPTTLKKSPSPAPATARPKQNTARLWLAASIAEPTAKIAAPSAIVYLLLCGERLTTAIRREHAPADTVAHGARDHACEDARHEDDRAARPSAPRDEHRRALHAHDHTLWEWLEHGDLALKRRCRDQRVYGRRVAAKESAHRAVVEHQCRAEQHSPERLTHATKVASAIARYFGASLCMTAEMGLVTGSIATSSTRMSTIVSSEEERAGAATER